MKRLFDLLLSIPMFFLLLPLMLAIAAIVRATSAGPALHWSTRIGRNGRQFAMPKFRTMRVDTPQRATHLLENSERWITPIGRRLRKLSLDELPQLASIITGEMSFVGPRPALYNQSDLIARRAAAGVDSFAPGLTGWAQVNGRDELSLDEKVAFDAEYILRQNLLFDSRILLLTAWQALRGRGIAEGKPVSRRNAA